MGQGLSRESLIDRAGPNDLTNLAVDRGPSPMNIGAVLVVEDAIGIDLATVRDLLSARLPRVPRLRQRLQSAPVGCGRPVWVDDPAFDLARHLGSIRLTSAQLASAGSVDSRGPADSPGPADSATRDGVAPPELLRLAADLVCRHLPRDRPLWSAQWVTGLGDRAALVLVVHHAMADGLGGLAVLAALGDEGSDPAEGGFPRPMLGWSALAADAWRVRADRLSRSRVELARTLHGVRELGLGLKRPELAPATSLNRPTGSRRTLTTVSTPLPAVVTLAHARGCTVNDVVLTAIVGALSRTLQRRGEHPAELVVSVPVSSRRSASSDDPGNRTGVVPMRLPTAGAPAVRLRSIAAISKDRRAGPPGASAAPLGVVFRMLARVGLFQLFIDRQRLVNTFVTNVRGPVTELGLGGRPVSALIPVAVNPGNVGVSFDVMSYAGRLGVTIVADPDVVPDQDVLTALLEDELQELLRATASEASEV